MLEDVWRRTIPMKKHCQSCAAPLDDPAFQGGSAHYCRYCVDKSGKLVTRAQALQNVIGWFKTWQTEATEEQLQRRAEHYLLSMPAWAE
jgi:hypothetical protein